MKRRGTEYQCFEEAIDYLMATFPTLEVDTSKTNAPVHAEARIPAQPGLDFQISINLQNDDELHLCVANLWVCWFPCGNPEILHEVLAALRGIISGEWRILETYVRGQLASAKLQSPTDSGWRTVNRQVNARLLLPFRRTLRVVRNHSHSQGFNPHSLT